MPSERQVHRGFYQLFIYDRDRAVFYRFTWTCDESRAALKKADNTWRVRDFNETLNTLSGLSGIKEKYMWSGHLIPCARCGKQANQGQLLFDLQRDVDQSNRSFIASVIIVISCRADKLCLEKTKALGGAKLKEVANRIASGGSKAWRNWRHATDESSETISQMVYLAHDFFDGNGKLVSRKGDLVFFPEHKFLEVATDFGTLRDILHSSVTQLAKTHMTELGGAQQPCGLCGKLSKERVSAFGFYPLRVTDWLRYGANKCVALKETPICSFGSRKCAQHGSRVMQAQFEADPTASNSSSTESCGPGILKCALCGRPEAPATERSERVKLKRCGRCNLVYYCSAACQAADWPLHKIGCKSPPTAKEEKKNLGGAS